MCWGGGLDEVGGGRGFMGDRRRWEGWWGAYGGGGNFARVCWIIVRLGGELGSFRGVRGRKEG